MCFNTICTPMALVHTLHEMVFSAVKQSKLTIFSLLFFPIMFTLIEIRNLQWHEF